MLIRNVSWVQNQRICVTISEGSCDTVTLKNWVMMLKIQLCHHKNKSILNDKNVHNFTILLYFFKSNLVSIHSSKNNLTEPKLFDLSSKSMQSCYVLNIS